MENKQVLGTLDIDVAPFADFEQSRKETKFLVPAKKAKGKDVQINAVVSCRQLQENKQEPNPSAAEEEEHNLSDMSSCSESDAESDADDGQLNGASAGRTPHACAALRSVFALSESDWFGSARQL